MRQKVLNTMEDLENTKVSTQVNSIILVSLLPQPGHHLALDNHRVRYTEADPVTVILSLPHWKRQSDIQMGGGGEQKKV